MLNKKISLLALLIISSSLTVACGKKEEPKENTTIEKVDKNEEAKKEEIVKDVAIEKVSFKDLSELKSFSKTQMKNFENVLKVNKIDYVSAPDNSLVVNKNMSYEKYTKEFNQLAYANVSKDFENGTGYFKAGLKLNVHMQEEISINNNFVKAMFDVIKIYNPNINEEEFNNEIKSATNNPNNVSDVDITTHVKGITIKVYSKPDVNEREIVLSLRQDLEIPKSNSLLKEYKTVQEFKDDSQRLDASIQQKVDRLNEVLKNSYVGKYKELEVSAQEYKADYSQFAQSVKLEYKGSQITGLQDELLTGLYEIIEDVLTKEHVSKVLTLDDFKSYMKSLEIYAGAHTTGSVIDELGEAIEPNRLPLISELELSISFKPSNGNSINQEEVVEDKNENSISLYDSVITLHLNIPVKAEGITSL